MRALFVAVLINSFESTYQITVGTGSCGLFFLCIAETQLLSIYINELVSIIQMNAQLSIKEASFQFSVLKKSVVDN